jgi:hypothetical protein
MGLVSSPSYPGRTWPHKDGLGPDDHLRITVILAQLLPDQLMQPGHPGHPFLQPLTGQHPALFIDQLQGVWRAAARFVAVSPSAWNGSWNGSPGNPLVLGAAAALFVWHRCR